MSETRRFFVPGKAEGKPDSKSTFVVCSLCKGRAGNKHCPKCRGRGGFSFRYPPKGAKLLTAHIRSCFEIEYPVHKPFDGPVRVRIVALFVPNKSDAKWFTEHVAMYETPWTKKPDADNIHKSLDALTGIAWRDDSQIFQTTVLKRYCLGNEVPGTEIVIEHCPDLVPHKESTRK